MPVTPVSDSGGNELGFNVARFFFKPSRLPPDTFGVVQFRGTEGLSQPFKFDLKLVTDDAYVKFEDVVNHPAVFEMMRRDQPVQVAGIVTDFAQAGRSGDLVAYQATLRPRLWTLSLNFQSRIFQDMTVEEILREVFSEAGLASDVRFDLKENEPRHREYCVQYQETDLNFVSRLMEYEGIYYFFEHEKGRDVMVITDHRGAHEPIQDPSNVPFHEGAGMVGERDETIKRLVCRERIVTGSVVLNDYDYQKPLEQQVVESELNPKMPGRRYEYGEPLKDMGRLLARIRNEEIECRRRVLQGAGDIPGLRSGYTFKLENHFRDDFNEHYLITKVTHEGGQGGGMGIDWGDDDGEPGELSYRNEFTCIPVGVQYRPPRTTPKPQVPGIMTATLETAGGDYAYIDDEGRYRARLHFDLSDRSSGTASLPIRMNQPHGGPDYGIHFPNHSENEIILAYENGDIDRPVALGTVPNPANRSPVTSENRMQNVVRTHAGNQLVMDDTIDKARVQLNSADENTLVLDDEQDQIRLATTNKHTATLDDKKKNIKVQTADGHFVIMDDENKKITVQSKSGHVISINDKDENITIADESGANSFTIDIKNKKLVIRSDNGDIDLHAPSGVIDIKAKELNIETSGDTNMQAANITSKAKGDHKTEGVNVSAKASMDYKQEGLNVTSKASLEHKVEGTNVSSKGSAMNGVEGPMVTVKASGVNTIQGSLVKIN